MNIKHREQVADLILKDTQGKDLVVVSDLHPGPVNTVWFLVGEDAPDGARYKVVVRIDEV